MTRRPCWDVAAREGKAWQVCVWGMPCVAALFLLCRAQRDCPHAVRGALGGGTFAAAAAALFLTLVLQKQAHATFLSHNLISCFIFFAVTPAPWRAFGLGY